MPTLANADIPKTTNWEELERISKDLAAHYLGAPDAERYGYDNQRQNGVDIFCQPRVFDGANVGIQCKNTDSLTMSDIEDEIEEAEDFEPELNRFIVMTSADRDNDLQSSVRQLSEEREEEGRFTVSIWFWEKIKTTLANYPDLMESHYPQFFSQQEEEEIDEFIEERYQAIRNRSDIVAALPDGPAFALHIVPRHTSSENTTFDLDRVDDMPPLIIYGQTYGHEMTYEGKMAVSAINGNPASYTHIDEEGRIEAVDSRYLQSEDEEEDFFYLGGFYRNIQEHIVPVVQELEECGFERPMDVFIAFFGVDGFQVNHNDRRMRYNDSVNREELTYEAVLSEDDDLMNIVAEFFERIYNACGIEVAPSFTS